MFNYDVGCDGVDVSDGGGLFVAPNPSVTILGISPMMEFMLNSYSSLAPCCVNCMEYWLGSTDTISPITFKILGS